MQQAEKDLLLPLALCQNVLDMESEAPKVLTERALVYFRSAAESLHALEANLGDWAKITFRPRVLRDVAWVDMSTRIMGQMCRLPFFISPMAMIKLADEDGELALARAAGLKRIPYAVSTYTSYSLEEISQCVRDEKLDAALIFQLYVPKKRQDCVNLVSRARRLGFKALLITVDTPVVGKREEDDLYKARIDYDAGVVTTPPPPPAEVTEDGERPILRGYHSSTLKWDDLGWIREAWGKDAGPVYLKGIQSAEDALLACRAGVDGIYLSNHGGRQLDYAPSAAQTLLEIRRFCPQILGKLEIYLDGGIRRGSDILKALCLGATAVGLGRPFVYALGAYRQQGVLRAIECEYESIKTYRYFHTTKDLADHGLTVLSDEVETAMRLLGVNSLSELNANHVNTKALEANIVDSVQMPSRLAARL
jgi:L-lactate dehydrogenase (cytochrome)